VATRAGADWRLTITTVHTALALALAALAIIVLVELVATRSGLPAAALLTVCGLIYGFLPGPNVDLNPDLVLTFVLPPLLYNTALNSSLLAIRGNLRSVISLSVALVLVTALLVGVGVDLFVPGVTLAAGVALGAAVAPPDPVAALAIGRRVGLPARLITLIEGEGLLNDATALTTFLVAVGAAKSGDFSYGRTALTLLIVSIGGIAVGAVVAGLIRLTRAVINEPIVHNALSLGTPFAAFFFGEELHVSGVLAVVVAGLIIGHDTPRAVSGASRLQTNAVWRLVDFFLEGVVFLLIGQQLPKVVRALSPYSVSMITIAATITVGVALLIRPLWLVLTQTLPRNLRLGSDAGVQSRLSGREVAALSWSGTRGVISLVAAFSLPLFTDSGAPFPGRDLIIFCTYLVVLVTLIGQGVTFGPFVRALGLRADLADQIRIRNQARLASLTAGLHRLDEFVTEHSAQSEQSAAARLAAAGRADDNSLEDGDRLDITGERVDLAGEASDELVDERIDEESIEALRARLQGQLARAQRRIDSTDPNDLAEGATPVRAAADIAVAALRRSVIDAQREELLLWRNAGRLPDASLRILQRELDHEEHALPGMNPI
jgi:Na+/H+ antiporter